MKIKKEIKKIVLDTNFLLIPFYYKIDIFSEIAYSIQTSYKLIIPSSVVYELKSLSKNKGKEGIAARLALKIIETRKKDVAIISTTLKPDDWIAQFAEKENAIVCTVDKELKKKIKSLGRSVITLRSKSRIWFE